MTTDKPQQRLLRLPEVLARVALSKSTLYARVRCWGIPQASASGNAFRVGGIGS